MFNRSLFVHILRRSVLHQRRDPDEVIEAPGVVAVSHNGYNQNRTGKIRGNAMRFAWMKMKVEGYPLIIDSLEWVWEGLLYLLRFLTALKNFRCMPR